MKTRCSYFSWGILIWILLLQFQSFAQSDEKSLKMKLDTVSGKEKIMTLNRLSDAVLYNSPQQSLKYGIEALNLAKKDSSIQMLGESYLSVAYALRYLGEYKKALDSLYITIGFINDLDDKRLQSQILNLIGLIHQNLGNDTLSLDNYFKSFDLAKEANDEFGMISTLNNLGNFYMNAGNYKKSTEYFFKCLKVYEQINNEKGMAQMYNNIGTVYQKQGNHSKALEYHLKAYEIIKKYPDYKVGLSYVYNNLGVCYINTKEYDKASYYLLESISICNELGLYEYLLANYNNLGIVYKEKKEFRLAIEYLLEGLKLADKTKNKESTSKYLLNIADVYLVEKKYDRALSYFNRAIHYNKELNDFFLLSENNYGLYEVYKGVGEYNESLKYLETYLLYRDSLDIINSTKLIAEVEAQYELDKKEQRITTLQKDSRIKELEIERNNIKTKLLFIGISSLFLILVLIFYFFIQRIKTNRKLSEQNRQINDQNEELNAINEKLGESEKALQKSNETKDKFLSIITHDLKNPILSLKSFVFAIKSGYNSYSNDELKENFNQLDHSLKSVTELMNNVLNWAKAQQNQINPKEEIINLNNLISSNINSVIDFAQIKTLNIYNEINKDICITADRNMLDLIIRNILQNAIKFSNPNGKIVINSEIESNYISISIIDNGIGISEKTLRILNSESENITTEGTNKEKGSGLGLLLCKDFLKIMNGKLIIESIQGKGSCFKIMLPIV